MNPITKRPSVFCRYVGAIVPAKQLTEAVQQKKKAVQNRVLHRFSLSKKDGLLRYSFSFRPSLKASPTRSVTR